ncbi:Maf family protein [Bordetella pseudohinzii]|uniref:dTTP/UTP pyrophosphatase n=1 Tax=Bordetella pseudohinzii TaxID=1331258 RepID=A0A0J6BZM4_9BORD|nr:Maf family protein [Bordetella pseudohinzii]ANY15694.1 septum formation protein Maf [Bordetella pseudohinzii]KMM23966.1 septum formation inhibitor Maf [Bordetella pseudohinzii]KXA75220.1 septum formation inhibitor Maf [Bordetella pseudohinzii]KXA77168.1 septum formation inhibitor Maf [Bordetella pseudohinzii]CUJ17266.1 Maf-like protein yhdE [Bordetella pseudohinzii]
MDRPARLYLASASPRRRELLAQIGLEHTVLRVPAPAGEDEPQLAGEAAADYVRRTAREKAQRGLAWMLDQGLPALPLLAADTTVILDGQVLGKPADREDALRILARLSGSTHEVHTAVVVAQGADLHEAVSITQVSMRELTPAERERYCDSGEPYGKAGAYGIQGLAGSFIRHISGSYTGVMGLPLFETAQLLRLAGIALP